VGSHEPGPQGCVRLRRYASRQRPSALPRRCSTHSPGSSPYDGPPTRRPIWQDGPGRAARDHPGLWGWVMTGGPGRRLARSRPSEQGHDRAWPSKAPTRPSWAAEDWMWTIRGPHIPTRHSTRSSSSTPARHRRGGRRRGRQRRTARRHPEHCPGTATCRDRIDMEKPCRPASPSKRRSGQDPAGRGRNGTDPAQQDGRRPGGGVFRQPATDCPLTRGREPIANAASSRSSPDSSRRETDSHDLTAPR
jgi:hypothetical protein